MALLVLFAGSRAYFTMVFGSVVVPLAATPTSCASETRPLVPVPLFFFSLTLTRRRRRTSDKISSSQKFPPPHPALSPKIGSKSRHTRIGAGILQQERLSTCHQERNGHRSHGRRATSEPTPRSKALRPRQRSRRSGARAIGRAKTLARGSARVPRFRQICGLEGRG